MEASPLVKYETLLFSVDQVAAQGGVIDAMSHTDPSTERKSLASLTSRLNTLTETDPCFV